MKSLLLLLTLSLLTACPEISDPSQGQDDQIVDFIEIPGTLSVQDTNLKTQSLVDVTPCKALLSLGVSYSFSTNAYARIWVVCDTEKIALGGYIHRGFEKTNGLISVTPPTGITRTGSRALEEFSRASVISPPVQRVAGGIYFVSGRVSTQLKLSPFNQPNVSVTATFNSGGQNQQLRCCYVVNKFP